MPTGMTITRLALAALAFAFTALIVWAAMSGHLPSEAGKVMALSWGQVMMADLYFGFVLFAIIIVLTEPIRISVPVTILLVLLGNGVAALWLIWRLPKLARLLRGAS